MAFFNAIKNLSDLRKLYYQLALVHHPDRGGDEEVMKTINSEYEKYSMLLIEKDQDISHARKVYESEISQEIQAKINEIIHLDQLNIEVIGGWIWVTGNTFPFKDQLKELAFKFSPNKTAWYWHPRNYIKKGKKQFSMEAIRELWGSVEIEKEPNKPLTY